MTSATATARPGNGDLDPILRAAAGALFGALPLLYTMEMWGYARIVTAELLLLFLTLTSVVVVVSLLFGGFRKGRISHLAMDTTIAFGIGIVISTLTLLAVGQIQPGRVSLPLAMRMIALEAIPCAIGAALAMTQFRPRQRTAKNVDRRMAQLPEDAQKVFATLVGAVFFAFNVAPTQEPWQMTIEAEPVHFPLLALLSLVVSYVIVFEADFSERPAGYDKGALGNPLTETCVSYGLSLAVAWAFLLAFGHITIHTPLQWQVMATVMLGYVTTIGGSAGRVLVAE